MNLLAPPRLRGLGSRPPVFVFEFRSRPLEANGTDGEMKQTESTTRRAPYFDPFLLHPSPPPPPVSGSNCVINCCGSDGGTLASGGNRTATLSVQQVISPFSSCQTFDWNIFFIFHATQSHSSGRSKAFISEQFFYPPNLMLRI